MILRQVLGWQLSAIQVGCWQENPLRGAQRYKHICVCFPNNNKEWKAPSWIWMVEELDVNTTTGPDLLTFLQAPNSCVGAVTLNLNCLGFFYHNSLIFFAHEE